MVTALIGTYIRGVLVNDGYLCSRVYGICDVAMAHCNANFEFTTSLVSSLHSIINSRSYAVETRNWSRLAMMTCIFQDTVSELRTQCAKHIRSQSSDFLPFLTDSRTGDPFTEGI